MQNLHLFGNFYKLLLAVLMNRMRPCFEKKKNSSFFSFHVKSVSSSPATGAAAAIGQRRRSGSGGAAAAAAAAYYILHDAELSFIHDSLHGAELSFYTRIYLNYHNQFMIMVIKIKRIIYRSSYSISVPLDHTEYSPCNIFNYIFSAHMAVIVLETYI